MELSKERKQHLQALYESWGTERVRAELARRVVDHCEPPEVMEFTRQWLAVQDRPVDSPLKKWTFATITFACVFVIAEPVMAMLHL